MSDTDSDGKPYRIDPMVGKPWLADQYQSPIVKFFQYVTAVVNGPTKWVRVNIVERFRGPTYYYYHQKFHRVPTIDTCYTDDQACIYEAHHQFKRDRKVDQNILNILSRRYYHCVYYERNVNHYHNAEFMCPKEKADFKEAQLNFFIKYGDIGAFATVIDCFMKQKHRLIWERRNATKEEVVKSS